MANRDQGVVQAVSRLAVVVHITGGHDREANCIGQLGEAARQVSIAERFIPLKFDEEVPRAEHGSTTLR